MYNSDAFISNLRKKKSDYNNPDQATTQEQSLIQLSSGIYTEEERFVFELLQNAVDAFDDNAGGCLNVNIIIKDGYLVFLHNGEAFSKRDIEGLCDVGNGNKTKDKKKIGYKGIGFKSVFWSSCVTVASGGYCFKFDKDYWNNYWENNWKPSYGRRDTDKHYLMPWQIIPLETTPPDISVATNGYNVATYIKLGRKKNIGEKIIRLMSDSQFLLFVSTKNIKMSFSQDCKIAASLEKRTDGDKVLLFKNGTEDSRWLIHTNDNVPVPSDMMEEIREDGYTPIKLQDSTSFELSFAIKIGKDNRLVAMDDAVVYTYLPTSYKFGDEGLPFLVNANFITDAGRQQLHKDSAWNKLIFSCIPKEFLTWMAQISDKYYNYYEVLPKMSYGSDNSLETAFQEGMNEAVKEIAFIPVEENPSHKLLASQALMDKIGMAEAISKDVLLRHINRTYSKSFTSDSFIKRVWKGSAKLKEYGVFFFDRDNLKALFDDENCFDGINAELDKKLIEFLYRYYQQESDKNSVMETLKGVKFLLDENDVLAKPEGLFFPSDYREQNELAKEVIFLNDDVAKSIKVDINIRNWVEELGIAELDDITFIKDVICKDGYVTKDNAIEVGRFLFETNKRENLFEEIGKYTLGNVKFLTKQNTLKTPDELYLGNYYKPDVDLEKAYEGDIYVSEQYANKDHVDEWKVFLLGFGIKDTLQIEEQRLNGHQDDWDIIKRAKEEFWKLYNVGSWGTKFHYTYYYSLVFYPPLILSQKETNSKLYKLIWEQVLSTSFEQKTDIVKGFAGTWSESSSYKSLGLEPFIDWAIKNWQKFPATDGTMHLSKELYANTESIQSIGGKYLPIIDVDCEIDPSWDSLLNLKTQVGLDDFLAVLSKISSDTDKVDDNKILISNIYNKIIEIGGIEKSGYKEKIISWASSNTILSTDDKFYSPSELRYITVDGFGKSGRVYIGSVNDKDKAIELLNLFGVTILTESSIKPEFKGRQEDSSIKKSLMSRIAPMALLMIGENNSDKKEYNKAKISLNTKVSNTNFYQCDKIALTYGNAEDVVERSTFSIGDNFYYTGKLRPANLEPLMEPLCSFLGLNKKCASELFVLMIEDYDGIISYLEEKEYKVEIMEAEPQKAMPDDRVFNPIMPESITPNAHTGFKGEVYMYNYLKSQGYEPECPSIVSEDDDYDFSMTFRGETYYHKINYDRYDITFMSNNGIKVYLEVKTTIYSKGSMDNMPISSREWSMIDDADDSETEAYIIARIFSIDSERPDVYFLRGHALKN